MVVASLDVPCQYLAREVLRDGDSPRLAVEEAHADVELWSHGDAVEAQWHGQREESHDVIPASAQNVSARDAARES